MIFVSKNRLLIFANNKHDETRVSLADVYRAKRRWSTSKTTQIGSGVLMPWEIKPGHAQTANISAGGSEVSAYTLDRQFHDLFLTSLKSTLAVWTAA